MLYEYKGDVRKHRKIYKDSWARTRLKAYAKKLMIVVKMIYGPN
jgi:hypothetical protein